MRAKLQRAYSSEFLFYQSHHQNESNWRIHCICIPLEWLSWFLILSCIRYVAVVFATAVASYYVVIGSDASVKSVITIAALCYFAIVTHAFLSLRYAFYLAAVLQLTAWFVQVKIGHYYFEKNSPGMLKKLTLNSVVLSLLMALEAFNDKSLG